ncbi:MAG: oligosaccharide flippase family protein, partial [Anaerolineae bacterium]|nr:oligosaccharide flippase family protein [Anaerolineae bacterium]
MAPRAGSFACPLLILPLLLFWPVTVGSKTLLPADNVYQWEPYRSFARQQDVPLPPHNELLSDLVLENLVWKQFIVQSIENRELPLWNPHIFAGVPFLAAGQHSALYPLSAIFYVLPLDKAYGLFTVLQLWLAGLFMYLFGRTLRMGPFPALIAGIVYQLSAFFLVSVVFTMIIAAAAWLPLLLAIIEIMVRKQEEKRAGPFVPIIYVVIGAVALGVHILAGHPEILVYTLMVMALYALVRLLMLWRRVGTWKPSLRLGLWFAFMAGLGLGLGSVQLIPLLELVTQNFREGSVSYSDVIGWAYPTRQVLTFLLPGFFGNPAHHSYWDIVTRQWVHVDRIFWGIKNYVEAGSYVGILPLLLALVAVVPVKRKLDGAKPAEDRRHVWIFAALAAVSLLLVFGTPLYALLYYGLPGIKQLHSPFRWVFPYTLSVAVLAGFGARQLAALRRDYGVDRDRTLLHPEVYRSWISLLTWGALGAGFLLLAGLLLVLLAPATFVPLADRVLAAVEKAQEAFSSGQMLLSYQWLNLLVFALMLTAGGIVLRVSRCPIYLPLPRALAARMGDARLPIWQLLAVAAVALDLLLFGWGFNSAADPAWLEFTPPSIEYLQQQAAADGASDPGSPWRITTYQSAESTKTLNSNIPWYQGLEDIRGYDSIILAQYANYMRAIEGQGELLYNRIAPIYGPDNLDSPLLDLLGVRYVMTEGEIPNAGFQLVYDDEVRIYENADVMPRAFALPRVQVLTWEASIEHLRALDPRQTILLDGTTLSGPQPVITDTDWALQPARVVTHAPNSVFVDVEMPGAGWLLLADSYFPGWKAYRSDLYRVTEDGQALGPEPAVPDPKFEPADEAELQIARANGNFRAVFLEEGAHRVRFKYTPMSFKLGLYGSFMAGVVLFLLVLYWLWGRFYRESADDHTVKRVAKNSLLPMGLQLMNRLIDFAFAMLMLRILAPEMAGRYTFAVLFIGYFDILVRFGLGTLLTREVAKDREHGNRYLSTVTILRGLLWLTSLPLMTIVILVYAFFGQMTPDIVAAIALFAIGMLLSSLADGFTAVFNAYEKMEYP